MFCIVYINRKGSGSREVTQQATPPPPRLVKMQPLESCTLPVLAEKFFPIEMGEKFSQDPSPCEKCFKEGATDFLDILHICYIIHCAVHVSFFARSLRPSFLTSVTSVGLFAFLIILYLQYQTYQIMTKKLLSFPKKIE